MFQQFIKKYGVSVLIPGILCIAILYFFLQNNNSNNSLEEFETFIPIEKSLLNSPNEQENINLTNDINLINEETTKKVLVDVKGAVKYPGVYELNSEERIVDAIERAGGYTEHAENRFINHAQKVEDEMVIYVPEKGEALEEVAFGQVSTGNSGKSTDGKVNINVADESQLATLPGIGPSKAQAIIAYREDNGKFKTVEELMNVTGIGEKTFERLKEFVIVK